MAIHVIQRKLVDIYELFFLSLLIEFTFHFCPKLISIGICLIIILVESIKGWMGYTDERIRHLCREYLAQGFDAFKLKVGRNLESDRKRCALVREEIGWDKKLVNFDKNYYSHVHTFHSMMFRLNDFRYVNRWLMPIKFGM